MDRSRLIGILEPAVAAGIVTPEEPSIWGNLGQFLRKRRGRTSGRVMDDLIATLTESDDVCRHFDGKDIVLGNSATHMTLPLLVSWLLARCRVVGPELCAENLCRFLDSDQLEGEEKLVVAGVMVGPNFSLMNGISLEQLPIEADSAQLALIYDSWGTSLIDSPELSRPKAALICNSLHKKWIGFDLPQNERFTPRYDEMAEICLSLTALRGSCPVPVGYWWEAADWIPCVGLNGYRVSLPSTEGRVGHDIQILIDADRVTAREPALFFQRLNQDSKARLHVVLDRLNRSRRRLSLVDRAIELGIAGETLFLYEPGRNHTTELAFRMKLCAAWFLEETPERRAGVMKKMDALYKYRSAAVHTGRLDDDSDTHKALNEGEELIALATQKVLAQGGFPNWANLVLGST